MYVVRYIQEEKKGKLRYLTVSPSPRPHRWSHIYILCFDTGMKHQSDNSWGGVSGLKNQSLFKTIFEFI